MQFNIKYIILSLSVVIFIFLVFMLIKPTKEPTEIKPLTAPMVIPVKPKVIGWIPYWDQQKAFKSFSQNVSLFDFISVFWFRIDTNGDLTKYKTAVIDRSIIDYAHKNGVKALAVVANLPDYDEAHGWDPKRVEKILSTPETRSKHISGLAKLIEDNNLDGIDIDYENLRSTHKDDFSLFIEELADKLHEKDKILGVAIHPKTSENNPEEDNGSHAQDLVRISKVADQMYFMTYTQNSITSAPGPAGAIDWTRRILEYAIYDRKVPAAKIFLGIGLFGLEWVESNDGSFKGVNDDLTYSQAQSIIAENDVRVIWDDKSQNSHFEYQKAGKKHIVWYETNDSLSKRLDLVKNWQVGGVALWRLGDEDPGIWGTLYE